MWDLGGGHKNKKVKGKKKRERGHERTIER
jgi:hypothetical protein